MKESVEAGKESLEEYIITKSLTKHPHDYPDKKNLPHVQVAMRMMSNDVRVQAGDVIPYVICKVMIIIIMIIILNTCNFIYFVLRHVFVALRV